MTDLTYMDCERGTAIAYMRQQLGFMQHALLGAGV